MDLEYYVCAFITHLSTCNKVKTADIKNNSKQICKVELSLSAVYNAVEDGSS